MPRDARREWEQGGGRRRDGGAGRASDVSGEGGCMRGRRGTAHREKSDAAPP
eukprot:CAMPEP_0202781920 /NCGR_PEP_ID=MMETSP1388-20130828/61665_1 /ASSEMBLY_ACC=CAM_ASM_000864 /TAXON_ID=37098 /ORGANISM="Isochrysis sp, Strain CCMP1244" /LENGTH=51 /DNA_ID=CAMNT_0049451349 /DNA_START=46 /DNA_END=198 /DNA_ORIENTATION=+